MRSRVLGVFVAAALAGLTTTASPQGSSPTGDRTLTEEIRKGLESGKELLDWLREVRNKGNQGQRQIGDLAARIRQARENPAALSGQSYEGIMLDLIMLIPNQVPLPPHAKTAIKTMARPISRLAGATTDAALEYPRNRFRKTLGDLSTASSEDAWEAARLYGGTRQVQLRLMLDWALAKKSAREAEAAAAPEAEPAAADEPAVEHEGSIMWAVSAMRYRGKNGQRFSFQCPPEGNHHTIWGTEVYTDDSSICTAALHAGMLDYDRGGPVTIEILPGQDRYQASTSGGVTSRKYGRWSGSYRIIPN